MFQLFFLFTDINKVFSLDIYHNIDLSSLNSVILDWGAFASANSVVLNSRTFKQ